jgi:hypothetical protein
MPDAYYITNETSEDRLDCAGTLQSALCFVETLYFRAARSMTL